MRPDSDCKTEEANILSLSESLLRQLSDLQARLDNRFDRTPPPTAEGEVKSTHTNVLNEIIDNLTNSNQWLDRLTGFISNEVLPKIN